jgi:hypothetical protein
MRIIGNDLNSFRKNWRELLLGVVVVAMYLGAFLWLVNGGHEILAGIVFVMVVIRTKINFKSQDAVDYAQKCERYALKRCQVLVDTLGDIKKRLDPDLDAPIIERINQGFRDTLEIKRPEGVEENVNS